MDTPNAINPPVAQPIVSRERQISKVIINRVAHDLEIKSEMVIKEAGIKDLVECNISTYRSRRRRHGGRQLNMGFFSGIRTNLEKIYGKQIADEDTTFSNLRFSVEQIKTQYQACLVNYGMRYDPGYRDPFNEIKSMLDDGVLGMGLTNTRMAALQKIMDDAREKMAAIVIDPLPLVDAEAKRLNSTDPNLRKANRIRMLQTFAEVKVNELIQIRDEFKRSFQDEYKKFTEERVIKGHEDHGPTAIL